MLFCKKKMALNSYVRWTLNSFFTSQFLYFNTNNILRLKRLTCKIATRKNKKIHYFYLWLLTKQTPYSKKFYVAKKNTSMYGTTFLNAKSKRQVLEIMLKKKYMWPIIHEILWQIISKQMHAEKAVWAYEQSNVKIKIPFVPLTESTFFLQAKNNYFPNIPLTLKFYFSFTSAFQKLFFLRMLKFLSHDTKVKTLDLLA